MSKGCKRLTNSGQQSQFQPDFKWKKSFKLTATYKRSKRVRLAVSRFSVSNLCGVIASYGGGKCGRWSVENWIVSDEKQKSCRHGLHAIKHSGWIASIFRKFTGDIQEPSWCGWHSNPECNSSTSDSSIVSEIEDEMSVLKISAEGNPYKRRERVFASSDSTTILHLPTTIPVLQ